MSRLILILLLTAFLYVPGSVKADALVLLNFDEPTRPPDLYQSQGVYLTTILILNSDGSVAGSINDIVLLTSASAVSPPQGAFAVNTNPLFPGVNGISAEFRFTTSEGVVVPGATHFVQFNVIGTQGTWTILFFDTTNQSYVDLQTGLIASISGDSDRVVIFDSPDPIGRFVFIPSVLNGSTGIDNLQFQATSVPEPSTLLLLALGVGGLFARKRRGQQHK